MIQQLQFYLRHSLNDMRVNRQRTLFALLCIAAGVAAIVSLQMLGVMIEDTLTGSVQESNRGDLRIQVPFFDDEEASGPGEQRPGPGHGPQGNLAQGTGPLGGEDEGVVARGGTFAPDYITPQGIDTIRAWFESNYPAAKLTYRQPMNSLSAGMSISLPRTDAEKTFVTPFIVDVKQYPFYGERRVVGGAALGEVITAPTDIVLSQNLADDLGAEVGDTVRVAGATEDFTVRGIMPTEEEGGFENFAGNLLGYYFLDLSATNLFTGLQPGADVIYVQLAQPELVDRVAERFEARFPYLRSTTTTELKDQNSEIADVISQLVVVMGLISLLIGGIGIINTMLVIVSRRTTEIAVLKTVGLEAEQVTLLFLTEAVLMGIVGSLLGIVLGWAAGAALKGVAEGFLGQQLTFRITALPAITGLVVGVIITTIFGFLPTLAAGQVRPNLVLRPTDAVVPRAGRARSFAALLFVMLAISLVAQPLIRDLLDVGPTLGDATDSASDSPTASTPATDLPDSVRDVRIINLATAGLGAFLLFVMAITLLAGGLFAGWTRGHLLLRLLRWLLLLVGLPLLGAIFGFFVPALAILFSTFILVGILYLALWVLIWVIGRFFPTWRWVDLKLALRSMLSARGRNASTLLALVIGVFTLSLITMLASAIQNRFEALLTNQVGGNVIVLAAGSEGTLDRARAALDAAPGVKSYAALQSYDATLVEATDPRTGQTSTFAELQQRAEEGTAFAQTLEFMLNGIDARELDANLPHVDFYAGRQLTPADTGPYDPAAGRYPPIVIAADDAVIATGLKVGDILTYEIRSGGLGSALGVGGQQPVRLQFEIVGMVDRRSGGVSVNFGSPNYTTLTAFQGEDVSPTLLSAIVDVDETQIRALRQSLSQIPGVFMLETKLLNDLINQFLDQFTSFPILVAALALVVGGIVIANSVALSTLERRREIAIMKAVGLQRERVLGMLLLEYGLMGLIGGLIGVGLSGIGLLLMLIQAFGGELGSTIPYWTAIQLMLLCVGIALAAAVVTAWGASGEKPLNVLRYE